MTGPRRVLAGALYATATVGLAAVAAWPIYRSVSFLLLVAASSVLAGAIAAVVTWRRGGGWAAAGLLALTMLVVGVPLAVPSRVGDPGQILQGLGDLGAGVIVGWKDLLTVELPVGSYRNLLVPALIVFLVGTTVVLLLAWRSDGRAVWAVPVALAMIGFGLLFGGTTVSSPLELGAVTLHAPVETAIGLGALGTAVGWLAWRSREARRRAVQAAGTGVRMRGAGARRAGFAVAMAVAAAAVTLVTVVVPGAAASLPRDVLRDAAGPQDALSQAPSPLAAYRGWFTDAAYDQVLFRVEGATVPERIRLAVLDEYDGAVYRTGADRAAPFVRLPSARAVPGEVPVDVQVQVDRLQGIWMPVAGPVAEATFTGPRAAALAEGFYVSDARDAAVQTAGWAPGDGYRLQGSAASGGLLAEAAAPGASRADGVPETPASLRAWMSAHAVGTGGAALQGLVTLLRERGYLSHALTQAQSAWMSASGVQTFVPSAAGHSMARIDALFTALLDREQDPRAAASGDFVAGIGDDEQFAVAVSLIARELGFPSRIVVGARLSSGDAALPVCQEGQCRAVDMAAWVEVHTSDGRWLSIDVTPQHAVAPSSEVTVQPDPTIGTEVRPDMVAEVVPPRPAQEDTANQVERPEEADLGWLWSGLRITGSVVGSLLVVAGPFLFILAAKAVRRRARRSAARPVDRITGGWEEYLDAAADAGRQTPAGATRVEIAAVLAGAVTPAAAPGANEPSGGTAAARLAREADQAVFSGREVSDQDAAAFWRIVDAERSGFVTGTWRRLRAALSLGSFRARGRMPARTDTPSRIAGPTRTERGRRARQGGRPSS